MLTVAKVGTTLVSPFFLSYLKKKKKKKKKTKEISMEREQKRDRLANMMY